MFKGLQQKLIQGFPVIFKVKIVPKSSQNQIMGNLGPDILKIKITAIAAKGRANKELIKYLSKIFQKPQKNISIISGTTSPLKMIKIDP